MTVAHRRRLADVDPLLARRCRMVPQDTRGGLGPHLGAVCRRGAGGRRAEVHGIAARRTHHRHRGVHEVMSTFAVATTFAHSVTLRHRQDAADRSRRSSARSGSIPPSSCRRLGHLRARHLDLAREPPPGAGHARNLRSAHGRRRLALGHRRGLLDRRRRLAVGRYRLIRYGIRKAGLVPSSCSYDIKLHNAAGRPDVPGWSPCDFRSMEGFKRYALGATIGGNGLAAQTAYWSR